MAVNVPDAPAKLNTTVTPPYAMWYSPQTDTTYFGPFRVDGFSRHAHRLDEVRWLQYIEITFERALDPMYRRLQRVL